MNTDWIKENGKKQDLTSQFMLLAHANQPFLITICNKFATAGTSSLKACRSAICGLVMFSKIPTAPETFTNANLPKNLLSCSLLILVF